MVISAMRALIVRSFVPSRWSSQPDRAAATLKRFGDVEADSAWQYMQALRVCHDSGVRRMLFENVLEEFKHADYFYAAAHSLATQRIRSPEQSRTVLAGKSEDLPGFLAYAHVCEEAIHGQFDSYAKACRLPAVSRVFRDISADEESHGCETREHLERMVGSPRAARTAIFKARARRAYEAWMRFAARLGNITFYPLLGALFLLFGPLMRRPPASGAALPSSEPARAPRAPATPMLAPLSETSRGIELK